MAYQDHCEPRIILSALTFGDWMRASVALAIGGALVMLCFHLFAWLFGWPGPFLWFGTTNRLVDVLSAGAGIGAAMFLMNVFGSVAMMLILALRKNLKPKPSA
jgi:hypothetical protein